jgi:hypothetical protein
MGTGPDVSLPDRTHAAPVAAPARLGEIAVQHRERLDGSGYPAAFPAARFPGRLRSSAPTHINARAQTAPPGLIGAGSPRGMRAEVRAGRLDGAAVDAVLEAASPATPPGSARRPDTLEAEVLVLVAHGMSNKQIAERVVITPKAASGWPSSSSSRRAVAATSSRADGAARIM